MGERASPVTHYEVLGIDRNASPEDIKRAYRKLARLFHPDANGGSPAASRSFGEITDAYQTLLHPGRRAEYDDALNGSFRPRATEANGARRADGDIGGHGWGDEQVGDAGSRFRDDDTSTGRPAHHDEPRYRDRDAGQERHNDPSAWPDRAGDSRGWGEPRPIDTEEILRRWRRRTGGVHWDEDTGYGDEGEVRDEHAPEGASTPVPPFAGRPEDVRLGIADRLTQLLWSAVVMWLAGLLVGTSIPQVVRAVGAVWTVSFDGDAEGWVRTQAWGDLVASVSRLTAVLAVAVLCWHVVGRRLQVHSASLPRFPRWWRSPGWDGGARLLRVAVFLACAWPATAVLLVATVADHAQAHYAAAAVADAPEDPSPPEDQIGARQGAYETAVKAAASSRWRAPVWLVLVAAAWVASGKLPGQLGFYSRFDRAVAWSSAL